LPFNDLDRIFWFRAGLGVVGGTAAELITGCKVIIPAPASAPACVGGLAPDYSTGILLGLFIFLASYYFLKYTVGKRFEKDEQRKIYTTGVGAFALLFIFTWVLLFTLGVTYLNL
jgi:hypothetical protein